MFFLHLEEKEKKTNARKIFKSMLGRFDNLQDCSFHLVASLPGTEKMYLQTR